MIKIIVFITLLSFQSINAFSVDFWRYPEIADRGTIFLGCQFLDISLNLSNIRDFDFQRDFIFHSPGIYIDYVLPIGLPFSFGLSLNPFGDHFSVGIRPGYQINLNSSIFNLYFLYAVDLVFGPEISTIEHGARIGFRFALGQFPVMPNIEIDLSSHNLGGLRIGIAARLF